MEPKLDPEWFGSKKDNEDAKKAALDKMAEEAALDGEEFDRKMEEDLQEPYRAVTHDDDNICHVRFMPMVWDMDKAREYNNCVAYGLNPDVSISVMNDSEMNPERNVIRPESACVVNCDGDVYEANENPEWAMTDMDNSDTLSDALDGLSSDTDLKL